MFTLYELKSPKMKETTQYFVKLFFINRSYIFFALQKLYAVHLGVKITGPFLDTN
jgi:hypothetical protein